MFKSLYIRTYIFFLNNSRDFEYCSSSYTVLVVPKKDETFQLWANLRRNNITYSDPFELSNINSRLGRIGSTRIFSTIDLHSGYHQIPMNPEDQYKTAFFTPSGKYEYTVMPFGLLNASSTFARYMADLFRELNLFAFT